MSLRLFSLQTLSASSKGNDEVATPTSFEQSSSYEPVTLPVDAYGMRLVMKNAHATQAVLKASQSSGKRSFKVLEELHPQVLSPLMSPVDEWSRAVMPKISILRCLPGPLILPLALPGQSFLLRALLAQPQ